ncbi:LuxR C-terminal-related transcriptional regulator [Arthrobacter sp. FW305-BF8]|uniref:helix-turn-helix transcriptional regulator n=1 Tax=Arthrobacter sp. FW305-BF8 TaxID=2879617 RepID=UPI001F02B0B0|nr:LuxR C-terminal-related transcriptional regulator [Arthrobacter sp. FW305-BF8]UKA53432.1 LuxR C-terminal-related transcriptional regulator [Arthrobacter sp. FW305-BF8]
MDRRVVRVGVVDDHEAVRIGFAAAASVEAKTAEVPVVAVRLADTVGSLLAGSNGMFDVVALDMSLADGSRPGDNVRRIVQAGYPVLVFSVGDRPDALREALAAGASGVSRKSDDIRDTLNLVRQVADGATIDNQDLAAAIDGDAEFVVALSDRERETLGLYAAGFTRTQIASRMNVSSNTVGTNIKRIREKYAAADRPAATKLELYHRAVEDGVVPSERL